ncbi:ABC transporter substrate-binding protein [Parafrankia discariae]|uniref:ABC transporter substrate-binding protein n=1 Tax=Parafrankia discariae TaxID=365528 RepID=UPI00037978E2|nr:ABC transporter substrate-binding protein [Parafrankia discariae]
MGVTSDAVNLGFVYSDTGVGSEALVSARAGFDARIGLANEEGGINGRKIVYQWRDDENSLARDVQVVDELLRRESVFGLVTVSANLSGSMNTLATQGIPVVGLAAEPAWHEHQNMFSYNYGASLETVGRDIRASGGSKVAFVASGSSSFTAESAARYTTAMQSVGLTIAGMVSYSKSTDNPAHVARQLADTGADALLNLGTPDDFAEIIKAARAENLNFPVRVSLSGYDRALLPTAGPALSGVSFPVYFRPFEAGGAPIERYRDAMTRFAPETALPEQQFAMFAYIYTDLFLRGLQLAGDCPTREGFISSLRKVTDYDAGGLIEKVDLSSNIGKIPDCNAFVQIDPTGRAYQVSHGSLCRDGRGI